MHNKKLILVNGYCPLYLSGAEMKGAITLHKHCVSLQRPYMLEIKRNLRETTARLTTSSSPVAHLRLALLHLCSIAQVWSIILRVTLWAWSSLCMLIPQIRSVRGWSLRDIHMHTLMQYSCWADTRFWLPLRCFLILSVLWSRYVTQIYL